MIEHTTYVACPDLYDHYHFFSFLDDSNMNFTAGGGQSINISGKCNYLIKSLKGTFFNDLFTHELLLFNFSYEEISRYYKQAQLNPIEQKTIKFFKEQGTFVFIDHNMGTNAENEDELDCLKYNERLVFESDPLFLYKDQFSCSLYGKMNYAPERQRWHENFYYTSPEILKLKQVKEVGIRWIKY